ncbi:MULTISPECIES: 4Fe-4S dicluster domain-containing protein [unclassified Fusibacter]|uniref:4Fe-4S dicluster domain-containing protein n=1 Tax=unclassified Fusibacter TaxID=2624464 RepID=UPI001010C36F|nr:MULTISPECIES: reductive dehalogenase domain-containing protein [unclassified Fusibacter]MCK8061367.1 4Fe-4S dicluster domain-containing protein [Fusibacter sp. A2]NPE23590.1 4Fe-4S dicluster domain-containing protein [Fusibacter sp. A1]RXV58999.1 4Fe-4S dicluster domain-containing protein [Fusibacter sp. A1]
MKRSDERDIMFARAKYEKDSMEFKEYYGRHPEKLEEDDAIRQMPQPYTEGTATFHPHIAPFADAGFMVLDQLKAMDTYDKATTKTELDPKDMTEQLRRMLRYLGASDVGFTSVSLDDLYSHKGRMGAYGKEITETFQNGIVILYEMDKDCINRAPQLEEGIEVVKAYMQLATTTLWITNYIKLLGYDAKAHIDGNYMAFLPPIAEKAGLGEVGRITALVHPEFGPRVRLALVTTEMPLEPDKPVPFNLKEFCEVCNRCSKTCPGKAISPDPMTEIEGKGIMGWSIKDEECYKVWRRVGTDCGVCLSVCPFSQGFTEEEWNMIKEGRLGMEKALESYSKRIPIRLYNPKVMDHLSYPKAQF